MKSDTPRLAIIGAGHISAVIVKRAAEMGIETYCFAWEKGAVAKPYCDFFYPINVLDKESILKVCQQKKVNGVIAAAEIAIQSAAFVAEKMNLHGNSLSVANEIRNKYIQRKKTQNIPNLEHIKYMPLIDVINHQVKEYRIPCILKPIDGGGKEGIIVVNDERELFDAIALIKESVCSYIIEEYIEGGREFSVESLTYEGHTYVFQITDKVSSGKPLNVELAHHQPADITDELYSQIEQMIIKILSAVGFRNGPSHIEIKVVNGKIYLIEINGRLGGDHIAYPLTELSTGLPYISCVINAALGKFNSDIMSNRKKNYASVFFVVKQTEYLKDIFEKCQDSEWCYEKMKQTDDLILLRKNDGYRINYFIYYSENRRPDFIKEERKE